MRRLPHVALVFAVAGSIVFAACELAVVIAAFQGPTPPLALTAGPAVVVSVTGGKADKVQWGVTPAPTRRTEAGQSLVIEGPGGSAYQVNAAVLLSGDVSLLSSLVTIPTFAGGDLPAPGPVPTPGPGPVVVAPVASRTWAIAVFDTSQQIALPAGQLALFKSQTVTASLAGVGVVWRHYDVGDPAVTGSDWGRAALRLQKPALVLWRNSAVVAGYPVNLPANESDLVSLVKGAVK